MKRRPKKPPTDWRIWWRQKADGDTRMKWHTGPFAEVEVLRLACLAAGERHAVHEPGSFKA